MGGGCSFSAARANREISPEVPKPILKNSAPSEPIMSTNAIPSKVEKPFVTEALLAYPPTGLSEAARRYPSWVRAGCGNGEYINEEKGPLFRTDDPPEKLPDLSEHNNHMANILKALPDIYPKLKGLKTALGVNLAQCIKRGLVNKSPLPMESESPASINSGIACGDEESYTLFADLLDKVIEARHTGFAPENMHRTNMNVDEMTKEQLDPYEMYVLSVCVQLSRSIRGFRLPPQAHFEERRRCEALVIKCLNSLEDDLVGEYFPLAGSQSFGPKPNGMSPMKEEELRNSGNGFQEPDSTDFLSSGCCRHWPDARGIFHNEERSYFLFVNEWDHIKIISLQKGDDLQAVCRRSFKLCETLQKTLKSEGHDFMHRDRLGYILTCPSNLGTGMRIEVKIDLPLASQHPDFSSRLNDFALQARNCQGSSSVGGILDISNKIILGKSEIELINSLIHGLKALIKWERELEHELESPPVEKKENPQDHEVEAEEPLGGKEWKGHEIIGKEEEKASANSIASVYCPDLYDRILKQI